MRISFFEPNTIENLYPLTLTRPAAELRCGILTLAGKWCHHLHASQHGYETREYLQGKFPPLSDNNLRLCGNLLPTAQLVEAIHSMAEGDQLCKNGLLLAEKPGLQSKQKEYEGDIQLIQRPYDIFLKLQQEIAADMELLCTGRDSHILSQTNTVIGGHRVFIEPGAKAECVVLNASAGPIYIGKNAEIMEGSVIRGPFAMGEGSVVKLSTKVYGATALGPYCVIGGEVNNISMQGYSNKGHDGFIGNAVLGEWCNIGADSNCSNLKNNYEDVKVWNYASGRFDKSGHQFCGLIMGDHSKCGINTMFNTGTVVGVSANIFGAGFPRQFVPDFAWGGSSGFVTYKLDAAAKTAGLVMPRRKKEFDAIEMGILNAVFELTEVWRNWEV
jgi:UDP-N-acetylglucosamine diphosphorylase/glucosamine-1-phosphate N-acetyltransferase